MKGPLRSCLLSALIVLFTLIFPEGARAHKPSDSYLRLVGGGASLSLQWEISLKDLEMLVGLDSDRDRNITWGELKAKRDVIAAHALGHLQLVGDGQEAQLVMEDLLFSEHSDGGYAVLVLGTGLPGDVESLEIRYDLLFAVDPTHRGLVHYQNGGDSSHYLISPDTEALVFGTAPVSPWRTFFVYVREGVWHIWIGVDHILFLVCLLLPAVLFRGGKSWQPVESFWQACGTTVKIVTVFTLAHSITLWLAASGHVTLPSRFVEATIAFSIIVVAINNLYPILPLSGWMIAFLFGLIHGFGFANVLMDLGLSSGALAISLFGFNLGVELGQMAIVLVVLPLAFLMRITTFYRRFVFQGGSILIGIMALIWLYERVWNTDF